MAQRASDYYALASGQWENDFGPPDWHAVASDSQGIIAYFKDWTDATAFAANRNAFGG